MRAQHRRAHIRVMEEANANKFLIQIVAIFSLAFITFVGASIASSPPRVLRRTKRHPIRDQSRLRDEANQRQCLLEAAASHTVFHLKSPPEAGISKDGRRNG